MKKHLLIGSALLATFAMAAAWGDVKDDGKGQPQEAAKEQPHTEAAHAEAAHAEAAHAEAAQISGPALPLPLEGVQNSFWIGRKIISGSCPVGEAGFRALAQQGVKTIISVDGARPDEQLAKKYNMRYVHIPVTYGGVSHDQALAISRAVRDLQGPVFIHCHHGKHRGPTAAVLAAMADEGWTTEQAQAAMKQAGTSPNYTGLWAAVRNFKAPTAAELDQADNSFPAAAKLPTTAAAMVAIDERWGNLQDSHDADWKAPASHPDIDPPHEALMLREDFRELIRTPGTQKMPADYQQKMATAESATAALEAALRAKDAAKSQEAYKSVDQSCKSCHAVYRDVDHYSRPETK